MSRLILGYFGTWAGTLRPMKVALVGYGKMGHMIESLAASSGVEIGAIIDQEQNLALAATCDVAIEFTSPDSAVENLLILAQLGVNTVCGTTGWYPYLPEVSEAFTKAGRGFVYGSNFSVGVAVFRSILAEAARRFAKLQDYEAYAYEAHHSAKLDAPSGTLKSLVETMKAEGYELPIDEGWNRAGSIPGTHEFGFDSACDTITLRHVARNREGFARGALLASKWIMGKQGVYEFTEIL